MSCLQSNSTVKFNSETLKVQLKVDRRSPAGNRTPVFCETGGDISENRLFNISCVVKAFVLGPS